MWQRLHTKQPAVFTPPFGGGGADLFFPMLMGNMYDLVLQQLLLVFDLAPVVEEDFPF